MSLIHWWPLNGDTKDYGLNPSHGILTGNGTVNENGKMGKCYSSSGDGADNAKCIDGINLPTLDLLSEIKDEYSFACWFKVHGDQHSQYEACFLDSGDWTQENCWMVGLSEHNTRIYPLADHYGGSSNKSRFLTLPQALTHDQWYHLVTVYKNGTHTIYLNGENIGIVTCPGIYRSYYPKGAYIGRDQGHNGFFPFNGDINDVRIYDHALSVAEVQELKKALVLHYAFDNELIEETTNLSAPSQWGFFTSYWIPIETTASGWKFQKTPGGTETTVAIANSKIYEQMSVGDTWTYSCYLYKNGQPYKTSSTSFIGWGLSGKILHSEARDDGYFSSTFTLTEKSNAYIIHARLLGTIENIDLNDIYEIRYLQVEKKDHATPYTPSTRQGMLYNETGLTQPETIQNLSLTTETNNGSYAGIFNPNPYTLITTPLDIREHTDLTVACWAYLKGGGTLGSRAIYHIVNGSSLDVYSYGRSNDWLKTTIALNTWNHIAITYSANKRTIYINGIEKASDTISGTFTGTPFLDLGYDVSTNGRKLDGLISDYRVYTTCLNEKEIKELYNCGGRISDLGDALTESFEEKEIIENGKIITKVNKNHMIQAKNIYEQILPSGYQQLQYIESTGTQYIKTGIYSNANITEIKAHYYNTTTDNSQILFGMYDGTRYAYFDYREGVSACRIAWYNQVIHTEIPYTIGERYTTLKRDGRNFQYIFNNQIFTGTSTTDPTGNTEMYLFSYNNRGTAGYPTKCKMYSFQVMIDNVLIRNFIPARQISDGAIGLYDIVNNQFYTNAGSDEFIDGPTLTTGQVSLLRRGGLTARQIIEK